VLYKTRGIVLHHIKYSETSVIVTVYTESFGRQAYLINGVRSKKARIKANMLQPLFLLNMEVYHKSRRELQRVKEIQNDFVFSSLPYDIRKSTLALFIAEILYKTIQEQEPNRELFNYLYHSIQLLELKDDGIPNFHLYFLLHLTKYLGFFPENNYSLQNRYFDLKKGSFVQLRPLHTMGMEENESAILGTLLDFSDNQHENLKIPYNQRMSILERIIDYYALHDTGLSNLKSLSVLKEVFH